MDKVPVEFTIGAGGDPLSSALNEKNEDSKGLGGEDMTGKRHRWWRPKPVKWSINIPFQKKKCERPHPWMS